jgi:predicted Ser/Thr protein kinase
MENPKPNRVEIPETIGPFRIVRVLGEGGMGVVYLAERIEQFSQQVAIKILHPSLFPKAAEPSIVREGQLLAVLDHPGIVRMLDLGESAAGLRYIVMEYVDGLPLDGFCDLHGLSLRRRIEILIDVLEAVEYAHRHFVVHADLKPANILVNADGAPRLLDFGVATFLTASGAQQPATDQTLDQYTALYASPEQRAGERLTIASDIYSLGLIAQSVILGIPPELLPIAALQTQAQHLSANAIARKLGSLDKQTLQEMAERRSTIVGKFLSAVHGDIASILAKALAVRPDDRFQSVQEMHDELRRYLLGYPIQTRPSGWLMGAKKWVLRNKLAAAFGFVLLAIVLVSVFGIVWRTREASRERQIAILRLHDLVRLTDSLAGELYDSVHGLQGSEAAQAALLKSAHETIHKLQMEHDSDLQLRLEMAREYEKLARLELSVTPQTSDSMRQSSDDVERELSILRTLPASSSDVHQLLGRVPKLNQTRPTPVSKSDR